MTLLQCLPSEFSLCVQQMRFFSLPYKQRHLHMPTIMGRRIGANDRLFLASRSRQLHLRIFHSQRASQHFQ